MVLSHVKLSSYERVFPADQKAARLATPDPKRLDPPTQVPRTEKQPVATSIPLPNVEVELPVTVRVESCAPVAVKAWRLVEVPAPVMVRLDPERAEARMPPTVVEVPAPKRAKV